MERSPKSHREEQSAVAESKRKLANSKLRLIWERSIGGPYQKREARRGRPGSHHQRRWRKMSETTRRWALHFSAEPLGFSIFHAVNSGMLVSVIAYSRVRPAQPRRDWQMNLKAKYPYVILNFEPLAPRLLSTCRHSVLLDSRQPSPPSRQCRWDDANLCPSRVP